MSLITRIDGSRKGRSTVAPSGSADDDLIDRWRNAVLGRGLRIAFADGEDERVIEAACALHDGDLLIPYLVGRSRVIHRVAARTSTEPSASVRIIDLEAAARDPLLRGVIARTFEAQPAPSEQLDTLARDPVRVAAALLALGRVDAVVVGLDEAAEGVAQVGLQLVGLSRIRRTVSLCSVSMLPDGRRLICGARSLESSAEAVDIADIAAATSVAYRDLVGHDPASTIVSDPASPLPAGSQGHIDVLLLPTLDEIGTPDRAITDARILGSHLQGLAGPWHILTGGGTVEDIAVVALISAVHARTVRSRSAVLPAGGESA